MPNSDLLVFGKAVGDARSVAVLEPENLFAYPVVALEMSAIAAAQPAHQNQAAIPPPHGAEFVAALGQKFNAIIEWAAAGHVLVMILDSLPKFQYRLSAHSMAVGTFAAADMPFFKDISKIEGKGDSASVALPYSGLSNWTDLINYRYLISHAALDPIFFASAAKRGHEKIIGARVALGKGAMVIVPPLAERFAGQRGDYYRAVARATRATQENADVPLWAPQFVTTAEDGILSEIASKKAIAQAALAEVAGLDGSIATMQSAKRLFYSTDADFVDAVEVALVELGFKVAHGPPYRADLLAFDGANLLAIEAKGLEGAAKERDFRQALQWKAEVEATITAEVSDLKEVVDYQLYAEALAKIGIATAVDEVSTPCRPLAVIGTFRKTPLNERAEADFPDPVEKVILRSGGTGISGLGLYGLVQQVKGDPSSAARLRALLATDGVVAKAPWTEFLTKH